MAFTLKFAAATLASHGAVALASPLLNNDVAAVQARDEWQPTASTLTCLYLTNEANWQGEGINLCEVGGSCGTQLPDGLAANVSSAGPEAGVTCFLFSEKNCQGDMSAPLVNPGYADLNDIGFDKKAQSWKCWKWCGWMGTSSAESSATNTGVVVSTTASAEVGARSAGLVSITTTVDLSTAQTATSLSGSSSTSSSVGAPTSSAAPATTLSISSAAASSTPTQIFETSMTTIVVTHTYADGSTTVISSPLAIPVPITDVPQNAGGVASITSSASQILDGPAPFPTPGDSTPSGVSITKTISAADSGETATEAAASPATTMKSEGVTLAVPTQTGEGVTVPVPTAVSIPAPSSAADASETSSGGLPSVVTLTGVDATLTITPTGIPAESSPQ